MNQNLLPLIRAIVQATEDVQAIDDAVAAIDFLLETIAPKARAALAELAEPPAPTTEWPTEPGWYWFYGRMERPTEAPRLYPVQVFENGAAAAGGYFMGIRTAVGVWLRVEVPDLRPAFEAAMKARADGAHE